jgi:Ca2+-binding RTX toxin-like protein
MTSGRHRFIPLIVVTLVAALLAVVVPPPATAAETVTIDGDNAVHGGMYMPDPDSLGSQRSFSGKGVSLYGTFINVRNHEADGRFHIQVLNDAWANGSTTFLNMMVDGATSAAVAGGNYDGDIRKFAGYVKRWLDGENPPGSSAPKANRSVILSPMPEMNGNWTSWSCNPGAYRDAFKRFVRIFEDEYGLRSDRVRWSFSPNGWTSPGCGSIRDYYPGNDYVDFLSISAFNFGSSLGNWESVSRTFDPWIRELRDIASRKPFLIAQTAACPQGGDESQWALDMMRYTADDKNIVGFIWFNFNKECDWRAVNGSNSGLAGWRSGMQLSTTVYRHPLTTWFIRDTTLIVGANATPPPAEDPPPAQEEDPPQEEPPPQDEEPPPDDDPPGDDAGDSDDASGDDAADDNTTDDGSADDTSSGDAADSGDDEPNADDGDSGDAGDTSTGGAADPNELAAARTCEGLSPTIVGTDGPDVLSGTPGRDVILGLGGDDVIVGGEGDDIICGGAGEDILVGDEGNDLLVGDSATDTLWGGDGADVLDGGLGSDLLRGQDGNDLLFGGLEEDEMRGGFGADVLYGGDGDDILQGGPGSDRVLGGYGDDIGVGGGGNDLVDGGEGRDRLEGSDGADSLRGGAGNDILLGDLFDGLKGGSGFDRCDGATSLYACETGQFL